MWKLGLVKVVPSVWFSMFLTVAGECGPLTIGQTFLAGSTDPTSGSTGWALVSHGIAEKLFTVDKTGNIVGQVAESIKKLDTFSWEITLKTGYKYSDGTAVTAVDVVYAMTRINEDNAGNSQSSAGSLTWTNLDNLRLKVVSERATPVMDAVLAEWCFVVFLVKSQQTLFTGPFAVESFVQGDRFNLIPNTYYSGAEGRSPLVIRKFNNGQSVVQELKSGKLDMGFHLPATELASLRTEADITVKSFEVGYHYMMWHNLRRAPLSDVKVREAVDKALDRSQLTQTLLGGDGTRSLFPANTPWYRQESEPHADTDGAEQLLEDAGWIKNSDGTRAKDGVTLAVDLVAYPQRPGLELMLPVIAQMLKDVGFTVNSILTDGSSWDQLDQIMADKTFDLLMWAQNTLPAGDPQMFLNSFFRSDGGNNHAGLNSPTVDGLLDDLAHTETHDDRVTRAGSAHDAILAEFPVSNLMTPAWHVGLSDRLASYLPWGSDYYVIRADTVTTVPCTDAPSPSTEVGRATYVGVGPWHWAAVGTFLALQV